MGNNISKDIVNNKRTLSPKPTRAEKGLHSKLPTSTSDFPSAIANIAQRMEYYKVPGVSITVINNSQIEWTGGCGNISSRQNSPSVDQDTLFQAGSISKSITAIGALLLMQEGRVSLDEDVNVYLKRWKIPATKCTKTEKVSLRRLLSHTAGTIVHGFPGYSMDMSVPSIVDILQGKKPVVNTVPVTVTYLPGTKFKYSGGGTTIIQLLIEDITAEPFESWMQRKVLKPLGMLNSTFEQFLTLPLVSHAAHGHLLNGVPVAGKWHLYPEMAAAGLWSTPTDLAKFILYIQAILRGEKMAPLCLSYIKEIVSRQKIDDKEIDVGLGLFLENYDGNLLFGHGGENEGFIARLIGYAFREQGAVMMMNNETGWDLMEEITANIAKVYGWPHAACIERELGCASLGSSSKDSFLVNPYI